MKYTDDEMTAKEIREWADYCADRRRWPNKPKRTDQVTFSAAVLLVCTGLGVLIGAWAAFFTK